MHEYQFDTQTELREQLSEALAETNKNSNNTRECSYLFRDKERHSMRYKMSAGIMYTRPVRRFNGSARCPLKMDGVEGLFFNANVYGNKLPSNSNFGDLRLEIPVDKMLTSTANIYFAGFKEPPDETRRAQVYLMISDQAIKSANNADNFAKEYLIPLPKVKPALTDKPQIEWTNNFLYFNAMDSTYQVSSELWLNILYTNDIQLDHDSMGTMGATIYDIKTGKVLRQ